MVENFGTSVRNGIAHKVILTGQFVRTGIVPQLGYARVLGKAPFSVNDKIDKDVFKTKWGTAAMVIELVSHFLSF